MSVTLLVTGVGLMVEPISTKIACALSLGNKILQKIKIIKYSKYKEEYEKDRQTKKILKSYKEKVCRITFCKKDYEPLCNVSNIYVDEAEKESFL